MPSLSYILNLKARGFGKTIKRAMSMINRYGFTSKKMENRKNGT
jgi:acetolactate synthase regulatory subunit